MYQLNTQTLHDITTVTLHRNHNDSFEQHTPRLEPTQVKWITLKNLIVSEYFVPEKNDLQYNFELIILLHIYNLCIS